MTVNSLDANDSAPAPRPTAAWVWPLLPIAGSMFCLSALLYYHLRHDVIEVRSALQVLVAGLYQTLGFAPSFLLFLLVLTWSSIWFVTGRLERPWSRVGRLLAMAVMLGVFMNLGDGRVTADFHKGELGAWLASLLVSAFGYYPSLALVWAVTFAALLLATDFFFIESFDSLRGTRRELEPGQDLGVEPAVTDHLRGLASSLRSEPAVVPASPLRPAALGQPPADALGPGADHGDVEVEPAIDEPIFEAPVRRRRSRFDRWEDAVAPAGPAAAEDVTAWVPTPPDSQEIDDPERAIAAADAVDAPAGAQPASAEPGADEWLAAERQPAPDRGMDLDLAPALGEQEEPEEDVPVDGSEPVVILDAGAAVGPSAAAPAAADDDAASVEAAEPDPWTAPASPVGRAEPSAAEQDLEEAPEEEEEQEQEPLPAAPSPEASAVPEPVVTIPRPPEPVEAPRQQGLFGTAVDESLVQEAIEVVTGSRRASAVFLQRKLRIDYGQACAVMVALAARGIVALEADASQGRVLG